MKKHDSRTVPFVSRKHYGSAFFTAVLPCAACDRPAHDSPNDRPADDYEQTLSDEAGRLVYHAQHKMFDGDAEDAAGMLRDAARLLDLWGNRQRVRRDAEERKPRSRKAARS